MAVHHAVAAGRGALGRRCRRHRARPRARATCRRHRDDQPDGCLPGRRRVHGSDPRRRGDRHRAVAARAFGRRSQERRPDPADPRPRARDARRVRPRADRVPAGQARPRGTGLDEPGRHHLTRLGAGGDAGRRPGGRRGGAQTRLRAARCHGRAQLHRHGRSRAGRSALSAGQARRGGGVRRAQRRDRGTRRCLHPVPVAAGARQAASRARARTTRPSSWPSRRWS